MKLKLLTILIFLFLSAQLTTGQCPPLYVFDGQAENDIFGISVADAGDVNNDGYDDVIIGAYRNDAGGDDAGRVYVFSGRTGDTLYVFTGDSAGYGLGFSVSSAGDIDGDGHDDVIVGTRSTNGSDHAFIYSGRTGGVLYQFHKEPQGGFFAHSVSSAGDVNNDGYDDFIIGEPLNDGASQNAGRAWVFSGKTGDTLFVFSGGTSQDLMGWSVSSVGDVNNDSFDDIIVGAPFSDVTNINAGRVYVFSGKTGDTLFIFDGEVGFDNYGQNFGNSVASAGDVNNDGYADIVIGAPLNDGAAYNAGRAYVFSGKTGDTLLVLSGESISNLLGHSVSSAGDVDNDGFDDVIIGAWYNESAPRGAGKAYVFSGKTGDTLYVLRGELAGAALGYSVSSAGDINNDGYYDVIIGAPYDDFAGSDAGRVYVYSPCGTRGDVDRNGTDADVFDLTYLIDDIFRGGPDSPCILEADINSDGTPSNILDLTFLVDFIFRGGPAPGPCL